VHTCGRGTQKGPSLRKIAHAARLTMNSFLQLVVLAAVLCVALGHQWKRSQELMIPMRDGTELHTIVHLPRTHIDVKGGGKHPTVMDRSPYGYGDMEWITDLFVPFGFAGVGQDMRGTEKSQGNFTMFHQDANDSRDLGDWIVNQDWSDGRIFLMGASADGIESYQTPRSQPDWIKAQYVIWAPAQLYNVLFAGGTYKQKTTEDWLHGLTMPNPAVADACIQTAHENEAHTPFWREIELNNEYYSKITWPSAFYAGWWDIFLEGTLEGFHGFNAKSHPSVANTGKLIVDPCGHCIEAGAFFAPNTFEGRTALVAAQIFELFGIYTPPREEMGLIKNITFYVMSSNDDAGTAAAQYWTSLEAFPEFTPTDYFLSGDGTASLEKPSATAATSTTYKHDPSNPIPTLGGANLPAEIGGSIPCGPHDQQSIDGRDDMVVFNVAAQDTELVLTGPMIAELFVSSDMIDTDFMVRVSDVYNDEAGTVRLLQDNAQRMRWREQTQTPVYMTPNDVYKIEINLWNTSYILPPNHNLRIVVQSTNFPRFAVNNNNGILLADPAYPGPANIAQNTIYHSAQYPSKLVLPVVVGGKAALPEVNLVKEVQKKHPHLTKDLLGKFGKWIEKELSKKF